MTISVTRRGVAGVLVAPYTQTFSAASRAHPAAAQAAVVTTAATNIAPYGYAQAQADAIVTQLNNARADIDALKRLVNALIDDLQALQVVQ